MIKPSKMIRNILLNNNLFSRNIFSTVTDSFRPFILSHLPTKVKHKISHHAHESNILYSITTGKLVNKYMAKNNVKTTSCSSCKGNHWGPWGPGQWGPGPWGPGPGPHFGPSYAPGPEWHQGPEYGPGPRPVPGPGQWGPYPDPWNMRPRWNGRPPRY